MNVTQQIRKTANIYGSSDSARGSNNAAAKSLNYAVGASWQKAARQSVGTIPYNIRYADEVGLFGAENYFLRVDLDVTGQNQFLDVANFVDGYYSALVLDSVPELDPFYESALVLPLNETDPGWEGARFLDEELPYIGPDAYVSIDLKKLKAGNKYTDAWLDIRLYTADREEHPYDYMYCRLRDHFYIGIHARNTKRLPYNFSCEVGKEYLTLDEITDKSYVMKTSLQQR